MIVVYAVSPCESIHSAFAPLVQENVSLVPISVGMIVPG